MGEQGLSEEDSTEGLSGSKRYLECAAWTYVARLLLPSQGHRATRKACPAVCDC